MKPEEKKDLFSEGSSVRILTFDVVGSDGELEELAINIQKIKEVVETEDFPIQKLSKNYFPIVGIISLRGLSVPVLDLNYFLSGSSWGNTDLKKNARIVVCEFQKLRLGIIVERTHKIKQFPNAMVEKVPEAMSSGRYNVFNGIFQVEKKFIKLLDIEYILTCLDVDIAPENPTALSLSLEGKRILIVEDSKLFQKKLVKFFRDQGATIIVAEDGVDGIEKLSSSQGVDLIFTDIEMPRLNGIGMVRNLKKIERFASIPVIFNTSISNEGLIRDIESEKLGNYIVKFNEEEIAKALESSLKKE